MVGGNQPGRDRDGGEHMDGRILTFCCVKSEQKKKIIKIKKHKLMAVKEES